jgi:xanthine dehydrogenase YagS FAD-binding subunit
MRPFEYASPRTEQEAVELLNDHDANTAVLAGGTDLLNLMKQDLLAPQRVVDIKNIDSMKTVSADGEGVLVGTLVTLEEMKDNPLLADYRSLIDVVDGVKSIQIQSMGTLGGDLCHLPNCWYFRNGYGLLGLRNGESIVAAGDNRYHAIFGNHGPAKFVSATRFAPAMIAWGAKVRIVGPAPDQVTLLPLEYFYVTPKTPKQGVTVLSPGQMITHLVLPPARNIKSATYEVLELEGLDWPLAAASASLELDGGRVRNGRIVLGHVAPIPWISEAALRAIQGRELSEETAELAGEAAVANATPLKDNRYKVRLARTAVKRAVLKAVDQLNLEGGA